MRDATIAKVRLTPKWAFGKGEFGLEARLDLPN
jgi:hypothetical protein